MTEEDEAFQLAHRLLDEPNCDPDDHLRVLSRQLIHRIDQVNELRIDKQILRNECDEMRKQIDDTKKALHILGFTTK